MIMRLFLALGLILLGVTGYFIVIDQPPTYQAAPAMGEAARLQKAGIIPAGALEEDHEAEEGVFEVPPMDEQMLAAIEKGGSMAGMDMGESGTQQNAPMKMTEDQASMTADSAKKAMETTSDSAESMKMDDGGDAMAEGGLSFAEDAPYDREITLAMSEWRFSKMNITVKKGERIKFVIRNEGNIPHEFMFMTMPAMQAVNYRAKRADWNLLEHEALFEQPLLLPGGEISVVLTVQRDGAWMFMCMLPYHMQMGMMGQMATAGNAMPMKM